MEDGLHTNAKLERGHLEFVRSITDGPERSGEGTEEFARWKAGTSSSSPLYFQYSIASYLPTNILRDRGTRPLTQKDLAATVQFSCHWSTLGVPQAKISDGERLVQQHSPRRVPGLEQSRVKQPLPSSKPSCDTSTMSL